MKLSVAVFEFVINFNVSILKLPASNGSIAQLDDMI